MYRISNDLTLEVLINDVEIPASEGQIASLYIFCTQNSAVPTLRLVISDKSNILNSKVTLADGSKIVVTLGDSHDQRQTFNFRLYSSKPSNAGSETTYLIFGYYDAPKFFLTTTGTPLTGTASDVIRRIGEEGGIPKFDFDPSNDLMTWRPKNERFCMFARRVADHAYQNDFSFYRLAFDSSGTLLFKNLAGYDPKAKTLPILSDMDAVPEKKQFQFVSSKKVSRAGFNNTSGGYSSRIVGQNSTLAASQSLIEDLTVKTFTESLDLNSLLRSSMGGPSRVEFTAIDSGNVFPKYYEAEAQNRRIAQIYSAGVDMMFLTRTNLSLLQPVSLQMSLPPGEEEKPRIDFASSGAYVVSGKTIAVIAGTYYEKISVVTTGRNSNPSALPLT